MTASLSLEAVERPVESQVAMLPLCVDLDGTLISSDLLFESFLVLIKRYPLYLLLVPFWLLRGRATLKAEIAVRSTVSAGALPYNRELLQWLEGERASGRSLWLCTAANELLAMAVAAHVKLFDGILASTRSINLAGARKAACLTERFGENGFDYCGNEYRDIEIWKCARGAIVIGDGRRLLRDVGRHTEVLRSFPRSRNSPQAIIRALRPHQWAKNVLVIVPLVAAHQAGDIGKVTLALLATGAFCLCASSVYVVNDLLDLEADRAHARKSKRPFAAGDVSILTGVWLALGLLVAAGILATFLPTGFQLVLIAYYALTIAYSLALKGIVLADVLTLAGLYTLRVVAGTYAVNVQLSFWLLWFSMFLFLSLAFVKRYAELEALHRQQRLRAAGRGYAVADLPVLQSLGTAAGYLSVVVMALYINSPEIDALYRRSEIIWLLCVFVLYWISRVWIKAQRGEMDDDPVVYALKDRVSRAVGIAGAIIIVLAM